MLMSRGGIQKFVQGHELRSAEVVLCEEKTSG